jgi:hypothetical protein
MLKGHVDFFFAFFFGFCILKTNHYSSELTSSILSLRLHLLTNRCIQTVVDVGFQGFTSTSEQVNPFERVNEPTEYLDLPLN